MTKLSIAIIGSGPSGFYTAEALCKTGLDVSVDIIDMLATPFGLIRGGVAPDHQTTKRVARAYERTASNECVEFYGNVRVGTDLSLGDLQEIYDAVVMAIGMPDDRRLGIPGEDKHGVIGAAAFVGWYNGHPSFTDLDPPLDTESVAVIGNGNVAIDVARVLVKTPAEMQATDLPADVAAAIHGAPIRDVYLIGRRGPVEAKFTNVELREMGELEQAAAIVDPADLPDEVGGDWSDRDRRLRERNLATLREFTQLDWSSKTKRVHFLFQAQPVEILGDTRVTALRLERTAVVDGRARGTGEFFDLPCGLVLPAIGYTLQPLEGLSVDAETGTVDNDDGRVGPGVYVVGWAKRGPTGVIGTNKPDGSNVAAQIAADFPSGGTKPGREALVRRLQAAGVRYLTFDDWKRLEAMEIANARPGAPREKFVSTAAMLAALGR